MVYTCRYVFYVQNEVLNKKINIQTYNIVSHKKQQLAHTVTRKKEVTQLHQSDDFIIQNI